MHADHEVSRREFLQAAAAGAAALAAEGRSEGRISPPSSRPNILFLVGEQHAGGVMGVAGHPVVQTPHLDRLAAEGVYFPNAYCATPLSVPGRVAMFTSRYGHDTGAVKNIYTDLLGDTPTLARSLREAGYRTCHVGKTHLATGAKVGTPDGRRRWDEIGFDEDFATTGKIGAGLGLGQGPYVSYVKRQGLTERLRADYQARLDARATTLGECRPSVLEVEDYHDQWVSRTAERWLASVATDKPFYLSVNWLGPHARRDAPGRYATMYDLAKIDPPIEDPMTHAPAPIRKRRQRTLAKLGPDDYRGVRASYYGMISLIDDGVGAMIETLRRRGLLDNTLIVYTADHGEMLCDHGCVYKTMMYESSARIPLIARWPGRFQRGVTARTAASQVDLAPTLLEAASARPLPVTHGRSLFGVLAGRGESDAPVFSEWQSTRMIRWGRYKYVCDPTWDVQQLFDLQADPQELENLVDDCPDVVAECRRRIDGWWSRTQPRGAADPTTPA